MRAREHRSLPSTPASAGLARRMVESTLSDPEMSAASYTAAVLVSELVTNAVLHGGTPLEVVVEVDGDRVRVEVHDGSPRLPVRRDYSTLSGTGRGLLLVDSMSSSWGVERTADGKAVWFELDASEAPAPLDILEADAH